MAGNFKYIKVKYDNNDIPIKLHIQRPGGNIEKYPLTKAKTGSTKTPVVQIWPEPTSCRFVMHNNVLYEFC